MDLLSGHFQWENACLIEWDFQRGKSIAERKGIRDIELILSKNTRIISKSSHSLDSFTIPSNLLKLVESIALFVRESKKNIFPSELTTTPFDTKQKISANSPKKQKQKQHTFRIDHCQNIDLPHFITFT